MTRRVVTGHDADGNAVFVSDTEVDGLRPTLFEGHVFHQIWSADVVPQLPIEGDPPSESAAYFPPPGGIRFSLFTMPPASEPTRLSPADLRAALTEADVAVPGLLAYSEPGGSGFHTTPTIDFEIVLAGTIELELDHGSARILHPGDTVVQCGTRHRWRNVGEDDATFAVFLVGTSHRDVPYVDVEVDRPETGSPR